MDLLKHSMIIRLSMMAKSVSRVLLTLVSSLEISSGTNNKVLKMSLLLSMLLETTLLMLLIFVP